MTRKQSNYVKVKYKCICGKVVSIFTRTPKFTLKKKKLCDECLYLKAKAKYKKKKTFLK